ncbi:MAG: DUF1049 domain-containing protein [Hyphomicrobiales bacterium]|nr:DUF1049 domain-containing protein [Hyphomicrobiales bacterium]MBV9112091.1 DUF1049 domain-containing protein [Hyphomicrobiales bacterium]MBV9521104.1 DUF1049 domain-containing protein [Hyphomicrobiales bacterium]
MRGLAKAIILVPLALIAAAFAVGNRGNVSVSFDPFSDTPYTVDAPLFVVVFAALILGVLLGGIGTWLGQGRHRRAARMHRRDVERLRSDLERMRGTS